MMYSKRHLPDIEQWSQINTLKIEQPPRGRLFLVSEVPRYGSKLCVSMFGGNPCGEP